MYSSLQLAGKYLRYWLTASNGRGHGMHSPFVYDFIGRVLIDKSVYPEFGSIEKLRQSLLNNRSAIVVQDFGAGSAVIRSNTRAINRIAASSLKPRKFAQLLFRIARHYQPATIMELGTSFGVTTAYLASGSKSAAVYTLEGDPSIAAMAKQHFHQLGLDHIKLLQGSFEQTLPGLTAQVKDAGLVFIDGNHQKQPTLDYFNQLLNCSTANTIFIFDDIHWSRGMEEAWSEIQRHPSVTMTIDLFFIGLVFINPDFVVRQHFKIRF